jgi:hypothetical protein
MLDLFLVSFQPVADKTAGHTNGVLMGCNDP